MRNQNLLSQLNPLPHFSVTAARQIGAQLGLAETSINTSLSRLLRSKNLIQLKKGLYVSREFYTKHKDDISYRFYLANVLRAPSYVSSWTALQYYNLVTEAVFGVTSVTPKVTREYRTKIETFTYQSVKQELFSDFSLVSGNFDFFVASPAKALFDLLYLRTSQFRGLRGADIEPLIEDLRVDIDEMEKKERKKFDRLINNYVHE